MTDQSIELALPARYEPQGEIARGGMGAVWRVLDRQFDRPLAVKVMLPRTATNTEAVARFEREAQLTGSLQHPAIPPVVDRGLLANGSPYFSLKLIEGHTLSDLLKQRTSPKDDLPRFLGIFEQVCQAVGYAHSRGIIHRDLKPANIMVGEFGEVQVMDWGMAKRLANSTQPSPPSVVEINPANLGFDPQGETFLYAEEDSELTVATEEYGESETITRGGQVLGTLAYMPPEQARGEQDSLDVRADVFALGGILCKILTGDAPYKVRDKLQLYQQVVTADLQRPFSALDQCGADQELIALCKNCLAEAPVHRPADAFEVAEEIRTYEETTRQRLEQEKNDRAAAEARTEEEKKRGKVLLVAAGLAMLLLGGIGFGGWWYQKEETARATRIARETAEQEAREKQARADIHSALGQVPALWRKFQFKAASALLEQAETRLEALPAEDELVQSMEQARQDQRILQELDRISLARSTHTIENYTWDAPGVDGQIGNGPEGGYAKAFRLHGLDILKETPEELGRKIQQSRIRTELIDGLDSWRMTEETKLADQILAVVQQADGNPARNRIRERTEWSNEAESRELLAELSPADLTPVFARTLHQILLDHGREKLAVELLKRASIIHPVDFWVHYELALEPTFSLEEQIGHYRAALVLRPEATAVLNNLTVVHFMNGDCAEAEQVCRRMIALNPNWATPHHMLGSSLARLERHEEAIQSYRTAITLDPQYPFPYNGLGSSLMSLGRYEEAGKSFRISLTIESQDVNAWMNLGQLHYLLDRYKEAEQAYTKALKINPKHAETLNSLGVLLASQGRDDEAVQSYQTALETDPRHIRVLCNLGDVYFRQEKYLPADQQFRMALTIDPYHAYAHHRIGRILACLNQLKDAEQVYRTTLQIDPRHLEAHIDLARVLKGQNRTEEAEQSLRAAIKIDSKSTTALRELGLLLTQLQRFSEAERVYRTVIKLDADQADDHLYLGLTLLNQNRPEDAEQSFRAALKLNPKHIEAWGNLGVILRTLNCPTAALEALETGRKLLPPDSPHRPGYQAQIEQTRQLMKRQHIPVTARRP